MSMTEENHSSKSHVGGRIILALNWDQFQLEYT